MTSACNCVAREFMHRSKETSKDVSERKESLHHNTQYSTRMTTRVESPTVNLTEEREDCRTSVIHCCVPSRKIIPNETQSIAKESAYAMKLVRRQSWHVFNNDRRNFH